MKLFVGKPLALPGICFICRFHGNDSPDDRWIDADLSTDPDQLYARDAGAVYFCQNCLAEMATLMGYMTQEQAKRILAENEQLKVENQQLTSIREALEKANGSLVAASVASGLDVQSVQRFHLVPLQSESGSGEVLQLQSGQTVSDKPGPIK